MNEMYLLDSAANLKYMKSLRDELLEFGKHFPSPGGSSYYLGADGSPCKEKYRETWITSRMAHVYSIGTLLGNDNCRELAESAIYGLNNELYDSKSGGWYAGIKDDNDILPNKQCYAHAFVILAGTSGILANIKGSDSLLSKALQIFDDKFWDEQEGLTVDTWNTTFDKLDNYRGLNANMHTVEAFLAVADATSDEKYRTRAGRIISRVINWAEDNNWRIPEHYSKEWKPNLECNHDNPKDPFKPYGATPGHGIEWARLIIQWATSTYKNDQANAQPYIDKAVKLYETAIHDAWYRDGNPGIVYTTDWNGIPVVHDRMHWTLAEAINTSAVLYRATGNQRYHDDYSRFTEYLDKFVHDKHNGSWYHQLNENNEVIGTVWPGKSDLYHAFQSTLIPYYDISVSIAKAVINHEQ